MHARCRQQTGELEVRLGMVQIDLANHDGGPVYDLSLLGGRMGN
jgi:hypothetical protein